MDRPAESRENPLCMRRPPLSRQEFEACNRRLIAGERNLTEAEISGWEQGRDWIAWRLGADEVAPARRRSPRLRLALSGHIAGVGGAFTDDLGFHGLGLRAIKPPRLERGEEASVRLTLAGRSIYILGKVVWLALDRVGLALGAVHPDDERALQATVCNGFLDRWVDG